MKLMKYSFTFVILLSQLLCAESTVSNSSSILEEAKSAIMTKVVDAHNFELDLVGTSTLNAAEDNESLVTRAVPETAVFNNILVKGSEAIEHNLLIGGNQILQGNLVVNGTINASSASFVTGPGLSTPNAVARYADSSGSVLKNSPVLVDDLGNIQIAGITNNGFTVTWPSNVGVAGTFLESDGAGNLIYGTPAGAGNVSTALPFNADNKIVVTDFSSGAENIKQTAVTLDTSNNISGVNVLSATTVNANVNGTSTGFTGSLTGDVTGTQGATVVSSVGGQSAANVASATALANAATNTNTASAIVRRDGSGNFAAGTITANLIGNLTGNVTGNVSGTAGSAASFTGSLVGDVTGTQGATVVSLVGGQTAANVAAGTQLANNATSANTANALVRRDSSGNFSAGTVTADLIGNVTGNVTGNLFGNATTATTAGSSTSFSGSLAGDVTGTQGATVVSFVGGQTAANVASGAIAANAATNANTASTIVRRDASGNFAAGTITATLTGNVTGNLSGNATTATTAGSATSFTGPLVGDVTGTQGATVVSLVGGQTAANVAAGSVLANASTSSNSAGAIVRRDGSGNFSAGTITAALNGNASTATSTPTLTGTFSGDVTGTQSATVVSFVGGQTSTNVASGSIAANAATDSNTPSTIVKRDGSGNFSAGIITASLSGNASTATNATNATNLTGSLLGDVTGTQTVTVVSFVGGQTAANVAAATLAANAATDSNTPSTIVRRDASGNFVAGIITATLNGNANTATTATSATNFSGSLLGDVTGTQGSTVVSFVGGQTAASVASGAVAANAATNANTASTIVRRDASGNFSAGTITAALTGNVTGNLSGNATTATTATNATNFTGSLVGDVTGTQGSTVVSTVGGQTATNVAAGTVLANAATSNNTASAIVRRDGSGNFSAGTITASLTGNVTGNLSGNATTATSATTASSATNFTGSLVGDVTGTQGATVVSLVGGQTAADVATATVAANAATSNNTPNTIVLRDALGDFNATMISLSGSVVNPNDAATKAYVDSAVSTGFTIHDPAVVVSTTNVPLTGNQTIDGVTLVPNDRVLLVGQTNPVENGLWLDQAGAWTRPTDFASGTQAGEAYVLITFGNTNAGSSWVCNTPSAIIDTDPISFVQFAIPGRTTGANVGGQTGQIFRDKTGIFINFKTLGSTDSNLIVTNNTDTVTLATTATSGNVANTIVSRNASGNFSAGTITAALTGAASQNVLKTGDTMTGNLNMAVQSEVRFQDAAGGEYVGFRGPTTVGTSYTVDLPSTAPTTGQFLQAVSPTSLQWSAVGGSPIVAKTYYVAKGGSDSNDGSMSAPFLTVSHAVSVANGVASLLNPVVIQIGAGIFIENNSGGAITITAPGISIVGSAILSTILTPSTPSIDFFNCTTASVEFIDFTLSGSSASTANGISLVTNTAGSGGFKNLAIRQFQTGINISSAAGVPLILMDSLQCIGNTTAIAVSNIRAAITNPSFIGPISGNTPANAALSVTGSSSVIAVLGSIYNLMQTAVTVSGGANVRLVSGNVALSTNGIVASGGSSTTIVGYNFVNNNASSVNVNVSGANTTTAITGCSFQCADLASTPQGTACKVTNAATLLIDSSSINQAIVGIQCGAGGDTSTTSISASGVNIANCTSDIVQNGSSTLAFVGGLFEVPNVTIADPTNVSFAAFDKNSEPAHLAIGNTSDVTQLIYEVLSGQSGNPNLLYEPNYYGNKGTVYQGSSGVSTFNGTQAFSNNAYYYVITDDNTKETGLKLISDTSNIGNGDNVRGWSITKTGTSAALDFTYFNSDTSGQAARGTNVVMELDGFNNQVNFPTASNTPLPTNTVAKLVWATDTNLYRSSANVLQTDGNLIVAGLTANRAVTTDANKQLTSSATTATELGFLSGTTSSVQTQINGKVSKSGDTMTGSLTLPAGTTASPSLQFSGSTNTGITAQVSNTLSFDTNGSERMNISPSGTVSINGFTTAGVVHNNASGALSSSLIVNADIDAAAAIVDTKLATISTAGKVANSATTATSANTANAIVARDASGNFSAGTITAALTGAASLNVLKAGDTMTGNLNMAAQTETRWQDAAGGEYVGFRAPTTVGTSYTVDLPSTAPTTGQFLQATSATALQWATVGGSPSATKTYFVALNGSDSNDGSFNAPFLTVSHAVSVANGVASLSNPVVISIGAGIFVENNSGGAITITADGISIVGESITGTILVPTTLSNDFFSVSTPNVEFAQMAIHGGVGSTASGINFATSTSGFSGYTSMEMRQFQTALNFSASAGLPVILIENMQFVGNATSIAINNISSAVLRNSVFLGPLGSLTPSNVGISVTGSSALLTALSSSFRLMATAISVTGGAVARLAGGTITSSNNGIVASGGSNVAVDGYIFSQNNSSSINVSAAGADTNVSVVGSSFQCADASNTPQGTAVKVTTGATMRLGALSINSAAVGIQCGVAGDTSSTALAANAVRLSDCTTDIAQLGSSSLLFVAGNFTSNKLTIADATNVNFAGFDTNALTTYLAIGNTTNAAQNIYEVLTSTTVSLAPFLVYQPNYYGNRGTVYTDSSGNAVFNGTLATGNDAAYDIITTDRTKVAGINLVSDTSNVGSPDNVRGWGINKIGTSADLAFTYTNSDTSGQAARTSYNVMQLDGFNNQVLFPTATGSSLPTNTVAKLVWASDTNLYRSSSNVLQTDGNLIVAGLTASRAVATDTNKQLTSSATTATELGFLSGTTSSVQTQINGKVSKSGDTMTGALTLPAGTSASPSIQFTGSTNTGITAQTPNTLSFDTNGLERMSISATGTVAISAFTSTGVVHNDALGNLSSSLIVNADVSASAAIVDTKLATISTAGKVSNSATTATSANTANAIVARDASGNFSAGTITASLTGAASLNVLKAGDTMTGTLTHPAGTAATPSIQFTGSTNTGISAATADTLSFDTSGVERMSISSSGISAATALILLNQFANQAVQTFNPTGNGQSVSANSGTSILLLTNTANRTNLTVTFPPSPIDGQFFSITMGTTNSCTFAALNGGTGGASIVNGLTGLAPGTNPTSTANGASVTFIYNLAANTWYRYARG